MLCRHCGKEKTEEDFYRYSRRKCKQCIADYGRKWESENPEKMKAKRRRSWMRHRSENILKLRKYREIHGIKRSTNYREAARLWNLNNPEKVAAKRSVAKAIKEGRLRRPQKCSKCGVKCKPVGHHADYTRHLDVEWVCVSCHRDIHYHLAHERSAKS